MKYEENLKTFDELVNQCPRFDRKGKKTPYTSANGYMFSLLNKDGEFGIRFSKKVQEEYFKTYETSYLLSHGAKMKGYIQIPQKMMKESQLLVKLLNESFDYVMSLDPK